MQYCALCNILLYALSIVLSYVAMYIDKCLIVYLNRVFSKDALYVCIPLNGHLLSTKY